MGGGSSWDEDLAVCMGMDGAMAMCMEDISPRRTL